MTTIGIDTPNDWPSTYMKQKLPELKGEIDRSIIIVGDFNTLLLFMDKTTRDR